MKQTRRIRDPSLRRAQGKLVLNPVKDDPSPEKRETSDERRETNNERFSLAGRIQSFRHAVRGIILMLKSQHNAWVHAAASIIVLLVGAFFSLSPSREGHLTAHEWCWLVIAIMAVWTAEALNTALEFLANVASAEFHPLVAKAKDVAAGAVLISAMGSVAIALLILGPYTFKLLHSIL